MRYERASVASLGYDLPPHLVSSEEIEDRLSPVYDRLGLPKGRLELMTGIRSRGHFGDHVAPSTIATRAGEMALARAPELRGRVGCVIHASVSRDFLEPATANVVHEALGLPSHAAVFDVSNACLGVANGMLIIANMIELGQIEAGLVVSGENGKGLLDATVHALLADERLTRRSMKGSFAPLTIGSAGAAVLVARSDLAKGGHRLVGATVVAATQHHRLCRGGVAEAGHAPNEVGQASRDVGHAAKEAEHGPNEGAHASRDVGHARKDGSATAGTVSMDTDAEALLHAGLDLASQNWKVFTEETGYSSPDRVVTHQVGKAHQKLLFERLGLDAARSYVTFDRFGNVGSAALPLTLGLAVDAGFVVKGHRVAMLGIGSGLSSIMLAVEW